MRHSCGAARGLSVTSGPVRRLWRRTPPAAAASQPSSSGAGSSSDAPLTVSTDAPPAAEETLVSPGFAQLLETPRAGGEADGEGDAPTGGGAADDDAGGAPRLAGKRAQAHDIDIDIDIAEEAEASKDAAAPPVQRRRL